MATPRRTFLQAVALASGLAGSRFSVRAADAPAAAPPGPLPPPELARELPGAQLLGSARLRFFGMDIYQARLWCLAGFEPARYAQHPFALELGYLRALSGRLIAERSIQEMRRQGAMAPQREQAWLQAMVQAFPDVSRGDRITGLHTPGLGARFWCNGQGRSGVPDADFSRLFFGIWLSEATSEPQLRAELLGRTGA